MKLFCISDLHLDEAFLDVFPLALKKLQPDAVLVAGDFTFHGPLSYVEDFLKLCDIPIFAVPGNVDPPEILDLLEKKKANVHMHTSKLSDFDVLGFGGSLITPFRYSFAFEESEIRKQLSPLKISSKTIFLTHAPPYADDNIDMSCKGEKLGLKPLREFILEKKPLLNICGHVHEREGVSKLGETTIVKLAPAMDGRGALVELNETGINVSFLSLGEMI